MMSEMMGYIFSSLKSTNKALCHVSKVLADQKRFNRNMIMLTAVTSTLVIMQGKRIAEQQKELEKLKDEIEELKGE